MMTLRPPMLLFAWVITDDIADLLVIADGTVLLLLQHGAHVAVPGGVCAGMCPHPASAFSC